MQKKISNHLELISEYKIKEFILPHLSRGKRGFKSKFDLIKIVQLILKRLKTGCQWRELSVKEYFSDAISWQIVYYYFNKWSKDGSFYKVWTNLLSKNKKLLDMSSVQLDGSHTRARLGGEAVDYQGRKKCKTSNIIFLCDNQGQMLAMSSVKSGSHHDFFEIEDVFDEIIAQLEQSDIPHKGLFLNADAGFDSDDFRNLLDKNEIIANIKINTRNSKSINKEYYFDDKLYKRRFKIEKANAWIDSFKSLLIRFETSAINWKNLHYIAFIVLLSRKIKV
ncbi:IS5 family transposase [Chishuiella sp.]|uniref:IS5 family transposase n=1 Tax=Chishuiella sp. TaxID=1969467 RepID=UPI0028A7C1F9|nr:IS5 family transposase [Chishuiella sp.]